MKITYNDKDLITLTEAQKSAIKNDIPSDIFELDMKRRLVYWIKDRWFKKGLNRLRSYWNKVFPSRGVDAIPTDDNAYAALILSQPEHANAPALADSVIKVDDVALFTVTSDQKKIIAIAYKKPNIDAFIEEQLCWILCHKAERCAERLRCCWEPKLKAEGVQSIPLNDEAFCQLVMARQDYKDRSTRELDDPHRVPVDELVADAQKLLDSYLK